MSVQDDLINAYEDIIHFPHHMSPNRPHMPAADRAAQFSPFAALTGYGAAIKETARLTDRKLELDEESDSPAKIGYNSSDNVRTFNFDENNRPVLNVQPGQSLGELEETPSIRRITKRNNQDINKVH